MNNNKLKAIVFFFVLGVGILLPIGASAQKNVRRGGLFDYYGKFGLEEVKSGGMLRQGNPERGGYSLFNQQFGSDENGGYELFNQTFGLEEEQTPLGNGLLILVATGVGYALKKRKCDKKH